MNKKEKAFNIISVILLLVYFPVGVPFMWLSKSFTIGIRWVATIFFIGAFIIGYIVPNIQ